MEVVLTSPWIPPEWIAAHGLQPRGACALPDLRLHGQALGAGACAFAQSAWELAERNQTLTVFSTHCDQLRRCFDAVRSGANRAFLFNLPSTWQTGVPAQLFLAELERLGRYLARNGGRPPAESELLETMQRYATARKLLLDTAGSCPEKAYFEAIARFHWDGSAQLPAFPLAHAAVKVPLALVGGPLPMAHRNLLTVIEDAGGHVVLDGTEWGERSLLPGTTPDGFLTESCESAPQKLARLYAASITDVFQRPDTRLYDWLKQRLSSRHIRGILLWHFVGCDLWRAEAQSLRETFQLPVLLLEADDTAGASNRTAGRIQAFVESLCGYG